MMMSCAFLLSPKQKRSTLFIHGGVDIWKSYFYDAFSFNKPFASGDENTGTFAGIRSLIIISLYYMMIKILI